MAQQEAWIKARMKVLQKEQKIRKAFQECLSEIFAGFGVKVESFTPAGPGQNGTATVSWTIPGNESVSVTFTTDTSSSGYGIAQMFVNLGLTPPDTWVSGATFGGSLGISPTHHLASDIYNHPGRALSVPRVSAQLLGALEGNRFAWGQFHELANSLSTFIDLKNHDPAAFGNPNDPDDTDTGYQIDKCMAKKLGTK